MRFENNHHIEHAYNEAPSLRERAREALSQFSESLATKLRSIMETYQLTDDSAGKTDAPDRGRRRFVRTLAAGAVAAATPNVARALDLIEPEWRKVQIAQKRLRDAGDPTLSLADFLCDSSVPNGAPHACFDNSGNRRVDPTGEPLIDIPRDQWYTTSHAEAQSPDASTHQPPENPLGSVTVEMPDGTTRTMTQEEFDRYINGTEGSNATPEEQEVQSQSGKELLNNGALNEVIEGTPKSIREVLVKNFDGTRFPVTKELLDEIYLAAYNSYEADWNAMLKRMQPYKKEILDTFTAHNVPDSLAFLVVPESRFRRDATSPAGARGPFQIMPGTARAHGYAPSEAHDPTIAAEIAAKKLAADYKRYAGHAWDGKYDRNGKWRDGWMLALASYNGGYVEKWFRQRGKRPGTYDEFLEWLDKDINERIIPNEIRKNNLGPNPSPEELIKNLPMTLENLTYPPKAFAAADLAVNANRQ